MAINIVNFIGLYETAAIMCKITMNNEYSRLTARSTKAIIRELKNYFRHYSYDKTYSWYDNLDKERSYTLYR